MAELELKGTLQREQADKMRFTAPALAQIRRFGGGAPEKNYKNGNSFSNYNKSDPPFETGTSPQTARWLAKQNQEWRIIWILSDYSVSRRAVMLYQINSQVLIVSAQKWSKPSLMTPWRRTWCDSDKVVYNKYMRLNYARLLFIDNYVWIVNRYNNWIEMHKW